jgi:hypothetical protein
MRRKRARRADVIRVTKKTKIVSNIAGPPEESLVMLYDACAAARQLSNGLRLLTEDVDPKTYQPGLLTVLAAAHEQLFQKVAECVRIAAALHEKGRHNL